tara:strand:- start:10404 stop:11267 length:864 start_codon:yes stop_codon:yes gene_type:complete
MADNIQGSKISDDTFRDIQNKKFASEWVKGNNIYGYGFNIFGKIIYAIVDWIIQLFKYFFEFLGQVVPPAISTLNIILLHILFFLFLYTIYHLIMDGSFPSYDFLMGNRSKGGNRTDNYTQNKDNIEDEDNIFRDTYDSISNKINMLLSNIFGIFSFLEPTEYIQRNEIREGRCDDIKNVTNDGFCTSNRILNDLRWDLNNRSEDYKNLPEELKLKDKEQIRIPFKEDNSGFYIPNCKDSYYEKSGEKTNLLVNDDTDKMKCKYVQEDIDKIYNENRFRDVSIGSYR